jgi:iron complex transport system substrate-binding protein
MKMRVSTKLNLTILIAVVAMAAVGTYFLSVHSGLFASAGAFNITDMSGRTVYIPANVERVVVLNSYWNEITCCLGASDRIVGIDKYSLASVYIPSIVKNQTVVGDLFSGISIETLIALHPDLVIMDYGYGKTGDIIKSLEALNISVVTLVSNNFEDQVTAIKILGKVLSAEKSANDLALFLESKHSGLLYTATTIPTNEKPKVLICKLDVWGQGLIYTYANSTYGTLAEELGGVNVALRDYPSQSWPKVSLEKLLAWNPDIIIVLGYDNATLKSQINSINNTSWSQLKAVQEGKLFTVKIGSKEAGAYLDWGPRMIIGEMQLAKIIQPNYYAALDQNLVVEQLFDQFYNYIFGG